MRYEFSYYRHRGGRYPRLWLAKADGQVVCFASPTQTGRNIPGWCLVVAHQHEPRGRWSRDHYVLDMLDTVRPICLLSGLHVPWGADLLTWGDVARELDLPTASAKQIVAAEYPSLANRLNATEAYAEEQAVRGRGMEAVVVHFGHPTCRQMDEGYWESEHSAPTSDGREVVIRPGGNGWRDAVAVAPEGARVVGAYHYPGMHGGCWRIIVCVPSEVAEKCKWVPVK